jgi:hypothetical protein
LLFGFRCVMLNPSLIHSNKLTNKISFIFVKMHQAWHPSCAKLFHIQFFMQNISYMFFWNAYSLSISRTFIRWSSNNISCTCSMISGVVALFGRPSCGSPSRLVWPRLNSAAHFLIVGNEGEESP